MVKQIKSSNLQDLSKCYVKQRENILKEHRILRLFFLIFCNKFHFKTFKYYKCQSLAAKDAEEQQLFISWL